MKTELVKLASDIFKNELGQFSKEQANETLRKALVELNGGKTKFDPKSFRRNKTEIFEIIEVALDEALNNIIDTQFNDFVETRNLNWGDTNEFLLPNRDLFKVAMVADGTGNLLRQRLGDKGRLVVETHDYGIKIYEELHRFLAGRIDWVELINKVAKSFELQLAEQIYKSIYDSYNTLSTTYKASGTFSEAVLLEMIQHVEAATGQEVVIFGTKNALAKIATAKESDGMKDTINTLGHYGMFKGTNLREIKQLHKYNSDSEFAIDNNMLMLLPVGDLKIAKLVIEGDSIIDEFENKQGDMSKEYMLIKRYGLATIPTHRFGIIRLA